MTKEKAIKTLKWLSRTSVVLALCVIVLGAWVRLTDAGLGCPDWPGCYGHIGVPESAEDVAKANANYDRPVETGKAWKEMIHRYFASSLGLLILAIAFVSWKHQLMSRGLRLLSLGLVFLVIFQGLLGMWTVTLLLKPAIVLLHLLGGMTILSLLYWLSLRQGGVPINRFEGSKDGLESLAWLGLVILIIQIYLGGWTSTNYAALICPDFPMCQASWWPAMDFKEGFRFWREVGVDYEGGILNADARTAIHFTHRMGALITALVLGTLALKSFKHSRIEVRKAGILVLVALITQLSLGIANIFMNLPLAIAVAHNGVAALLLLSLLTLIHFLRPIVRITGE